jgi:hypothetical protein
MQAEADFLAAIRSHSASAIEATKQCAKSTAREWMRAYAKLKQHAQLHADRVATLVVRSLAAQTGKLRASSVIFPSV